MARTLRTILGVVLLLVTAFATVAVVEEIGRPLRIDTTERGLYTLSEGTKGVLGKLNQPLTVKLYYSRTAALKSPDWIKTWHGHYLYLCDLLNEYLAHAGGKLELEVIDPRPFTEQEADALKYGLERFPLDPDRDIYFIFGLVVESPLGQTETLRYLDPRRQNFLEYDITSLIDSIITRDKLKLGVLSSLPVFGQPGGRMPGQPPGSPPWNLIEHLRLRYDISRIEPDTGSIEDVDLLLVLHPRDLPEKTRFAIDQFVLKGGHAVVCVDPYSYADRPPQMPGMMMPPPDHDRSSGLPELLRLWGVEMPRYAVAADRAVALDLRMPERSRALLTFLRLTSECMNEESPISAQLSEVRVLGAGVLRPAGTPGVKLTPILRTTKTGAAIHWTDPANPLKGPVERLLELEQDLSDAQDAGRDDEVARLEQAVEQQEQALTEQARTADLARWFPEVEERIADKAEQLTRDKPDLDAAPARREAIEELDLPDLLKNQVGQLQRDLIGFSGRPDFDAIDKRYIEGEKPVVLGYLATGRFRSAFPDGIEAEPDELDAEEDEPQAQPATQPAPKRRTGLTEAAETCAVVVLSDVDFLTNDLAYVTYQQGFFRPVNDNAALMYNALDMLGGSGDLVSIRSRGSVRRPFKVVEKIEQKAEKRTAEELERLRVQEETLQESIDELRQKVRETAGILQAADALKLREQEEALATTKKRIREIQQERLAEVESLGVRLRNWNILAAPAAILILAIALALYRSLRRRVFARRAKDMT